MNQTFAHLFMTNILSIIDGARRVSQSHHCFAIMYRMSKKRTNKTNKDGQTWQACKHSKVVRNGQPRCFLPLGPFWACLDPFGPVWTLLDHFKQKMIFLLKSTSAKPNFVLIKQQIDFCLKWPKSRGLILYTIHYFS